MAHRNAYSLLGGLLAGAGVGCAVTLVALVAQKPGTGSTDAKPAPADPNNDGSPLPVVELKARPSAVAKDFDFKGLALKVADPMLRGAYSVNIDSGGGGASYNPGRAERRHTAIWLYKGNKHEAAVWRSLIREVEGRIEGTGGHIDRRFDETPDDLSRFWERHYSTRQGGNSYWGIVRVWCVAGAGEGPTTDQRFTIFLTLDEHGP